METPQPANAAQFPELYRQTVERFAEATQMDAGTLLEGHGFTFKGIEFRFETYGALDPNGLFILVSVGQLTPENEPYICRRLLEMNVVLPAARTGYYALVPGTDAIVYCIRVELSKSPDAHDQIGILLESLTTELERTRNELTSFVEKVSGETTRNTANFA